MTETKVDHPEFGHVTFTNLTPRQLDVVECYEKMINNIAIECICDQPNECQKCPHVEVSEDGMSGKCMREKVKKGFRNFVVIDKEEGLQYMETAWSKETVEKHWEVVSEHDTKEEAKIEYERLKAIEHEN